MAALRHVIEIGKAAAREYGADHAGRLAAALSYYTIFSLVPLLFLLAAVAGFVFSDPKVVSDLIAQATEVAGAEVGGIIEDLAEAVTEQRGAALSIGLLLAAYSASGIFLQVQGVLGVIFHVPEHRRRTGAIGWIVRRSIALASAVVLTVFALAPLVAVAGVRWAVSFLPDALGWLGPVAQLGVPAVSALLLLALVALTFRVLSGIELPWRAALRGGGATALAGLAAAYLVGAYLSRFGSSGTLGALGGLAVLLFFFNVMWTVYLFGAEVTKVYVDYLVHGDIQQPSVREQARRLTALTLDEPEAIGAAGSSVAAFLAGFVIAWFGRRRAS